MYHWELMLKDGYIVEGTGNEKALVTALRTPDIVDGDVWRYGTRYHYTFWSFLLK